LTSPDRNHRKAHKIECAKLFEEIQVIKKSEEEGEEVVEELPSNTSVEPSQVVVEKQVVEKVIYRDKPGGGGMDEDTFYDCIGAMFKDNCDMEIGAEEATHMVNYIINVIIVGLDIQKQKDNYYQYLIKKASNLSSTKLEELREEADLTNFTTNVAQHLRDKIRNEMPSFVREARYNPLDEHEEPFKRAKQYFPSLSLKKIKQYIPKD